MIFDHVMADVHARACLTPVPHRGVSPELAHTTWPPERKRGGAPIPRRARPAPSESEEWLVLKITAAADQGSTGMHASFMHHS